MFEIECEINDQNIDNLIKKSKELENIKQLSFEELFNQSFMNKYTNFENIEDFFDKSSFKLEKQEDFENINEFDLDKYTTNNTKFDSWQEMLNVAVQEFFLTYLGLI